MSGAPWAQFGALLMVGVPLSMQITGVGGIIQKATETLLAIIPGSSRIAKDRTIPALAALTTIATFGVARSLNIAAQAAPREDGLGNDAPHANLTVTKGFRLRLQGAQSELVEMFPGFALAAALAQTTAPGNQQITNLLGLHVLAKTFMFYPAYLWDVALPRDMAHMIATGSVVSVMYLIALGAS